MPLFRDGKYRTYDEFVEDVKKAFSEADPKPVYGNLWFDRMSDCCPSITNRIVNTELDPSGMDEIPVYIVRAMNTYFSMFYGVGWYEQNNPNIYPGSGYDYFINRLKLD